MLLLQIHNQSMENKSLQNNYDYRNIIKNFVVKHPVFKTFFLKKIVCNKCELYQKLGNRYRDRSKVSKLFDQSSLCKHM